MNRYSIADRRSLVSFDDIAPEVDVLKSLAVVANHIAVARENSRPVILGVGAHVIKLGLGGFIAELAKRKFVSCVVLNGAGAFHELELMVWGKTSEDVNESLPAGRFGFARESADMFNDAAMFAYKNDIGLGEALKQTIISNAPEERKKHSVIATAPLVTVHLGIGTDVTNMHPTADGAALGASSLSDFWRLAECVKDLAGGVYLNIGSAVIMPEVFMKAVACANNLNGCAQDFVTGNIDFINHYRPRKNVLERISKTNFDIRMRHEDAIPALYAVLASKDI